MSISPGATIHQSRQQLSAPNLIHRETVWQTDGRTDGRVKGAFRWPEGGSGGAGKVTATIPLCLMHVNELLYYSRWRHKRIHENLKEMRLIGLFGPWGKSVTVEGCKREGFGSHEMEPLRVDCSLLVPIKSCVLMSCHVTNRHRRSAELVSQDG